jgi:AhpD family alkylhydroperoxidase
MARIAPVSRDEYAPLFGADATLPLQIFAHRPELAEALVAFGTTIVEKRQLAPRLIELVRLRVAYHNQCRSCMAVRYEQPALDGVTEALVCELERPEEAADLTEAERAAIHFADLLATNHHAISDETFARLREHFDDPEIVELCFNVALFVGFGRMSAALHMVDDLPDRFRVEDGGPVTPWGEGELMRPGWAEAAQSLHPEELR